MACVRILIADDHELVRQGLRALLGSRPAWEVCGEAADGLEAIEKAAQLQPDIVLLDVSMPRLSGLEAAPAIRRKSPVSQIVIVSQHDPAEMLPSALKVGARGFVSKSDIGSNLLSTIESIVQTAPRPVAANGAEAGAAAAAPTHGEHSAAAALRQSEQKFRTLFESIDEGFCVLEKLPGAPGERLDFRFLQANPGFAAHTGVADAVGRTLREAFPQEPEDSFLIYGRILASGESRKFERGQLAAGRVLDLYAFRVEDGSHSRVAVIIKDITERKRAEAERKQVEEMLRQRSTQFEILVNQAPIGVFLLDGELRIRQVNPVARPAFDPIRDLVGRDFCEVLHELLAQNDAEELVRIFRHTLGTGESHHATEQARPRPDRPATEYYDWRVDRIPLPEGGHGVVCYFRDVSVEMQARAALQEARDHLESRVRERTEELESAYKSLRVLSMRMMQMQDEDRRRIARDLHDSAGQLLAALGMELASLNRRAAALSSELAEDIQSSLQLVQQLTQEIRTASYLLHPPLLDDAGLSGALRWYVVGLSKRSGIAITLELDEALGRLPRDLEAAVFHIVQESLMNIHRHSGSKTATLRVARSDGRLFLDIEDEGSGIPADKLREIQRQGSGVGIAGMRERVLHFNGDIHITSVTTGTRIAVTFPVEPGGARAESLSLNS